MMKIANGSLQDKGKLVNTKKASKRVSVEDVGGNKHILKATVISINPLDIKKSSSQGLIDADIESLGIRDKVIDPPLSLGELSILAEFSTELRQTCDAMAVGVDGFGHRLILRPMSEDQKKTLKKQIDEEEEFLSHFFNYPNSEESFVKLRRESTQEKELTGNAYWELVPGLTDPKKYSAINRINAATIRITKADRVITRMGLNYIRNDLSVGTKFFQKKFRRFVQIIGTKKVFFKQFGDPRVIDKRTGDVAEQNLDPQFRANELFHFKIESRRPTPYGMPRFTGNIISIKGSRQADETNIITLMNNNIPSFAILANGGMLTQGSVDRIREFVDTQIKGSSNYSKWLILEGESTHDGLSGPSSIKIEIVPLTRAQHQDMLWQSYDENNAKKLRRNFRIAPILVGASENYDRATAQVSEALTEKYVYNPEREEIDREINKILLAQGIRFWVFKSNSPNVTNDEDLVRILTGAERSGALTPRIARMLLEDILNRDLPQFDNLPAEFNPDVPFSFTLAKLMHSAGGANQNGTFAPQGQVPKAPSETSEDVITESLSADELLEEILEKPQRYIEKLTKVRDSLGEELTIESYGVKQHESKGCC